MSATASSAAEPAQEPVNALVYGTKIGNQSGELEAPLGLAYVALEVPADLAIDLRGLAADELTKLVTDVREDLELAVELSAERRRRRVRNRATRETAGT